MSPTAGEQFGKLASIAVILTLLPYIYSCISIKVLGYHVLPPNTFAAYTVVGFIGAWFTAWPPCSDRTANRPLVVDLRHRHHRLLFRGPQPQARNRGKAYPSGGISPVWVRYASLIVTVLMLIATFWFAVAHREFAIRHRVPRPGILNRNPVQSAPPAGAARRYRHARESGRFLPGSEPGFLKTLFSVRSSKYDFSPFRRQTGDARPARARSVRD